MFQPTPESEWNTKASRSRYIDDYLIEGSPALGVRARLAKSTIVVNVRRGDYYSVETHRREFGIDVKDYLHEALEMALDETGAPSGFTVVSDDPAWCSEQIAPLLSPHAEITVLPNDIGNDLATVVYADRAIIMNSTFSYWACYIGDRIAEKEGRPRHVWAPWFFSRDDGQTTSHLLDPHWHVVGNSASRWSALPK